MMALFHNFNLGSYIMNRTQMSLKTLKVSFFNFKREIKCQLFEVIKSLGFPENV